MISHVIVAVLSSAATVVAVSRAQWAVELRAWIARQVGAAWRGLVSLIRRGPPPSRG